MKLSVIMCVSSANVEWLDEAIQSTSGIADELVVVGDEGVQFHPLLVNNPLIHRRVIECVNSPVVASNVGVAACTGDWVGLLSSDDFYDKIGVHAILSTLKTTQYDIVGGKSHIFGVLGDHDWPENGDIRAIGWRNNISGAAFFRKECWWLCEGFSDVRYADYHFWKKCIKAGFKYGFTEDIFHHHRTWPGSIGGKMGYRSDLGHEWEQPEEQI